MDELLPVLMAGTQRRPFGGDLLGETALRSVAALAGHVLKESPCPARDEGVDERTVAPRGTLAEILEGDRLDCLPEWLELCRGRRMHPALIPQALERGRGGPLLEAVGSRGLWLAAQNPDWRHHLGVMGGLEVWETGAPRVRAEWLAGQEPQRAEQLLVEVWKQENAETRALLLRALPAPGLGVLEMALADRSKGVRTAAAQAMWRFPDSAWARRMLELLGAGEPPPENPGFDLTFSGLGEKAGWLAQVAALAPLGPYVEVRGAWREALLQGFTRAALMQQRHDWALGLLRARVLEQELFLLLDWAERDAFLLSQGPLWDWYRLHRPYSPELAAKVWRELQVVTQGRQEWGVAQALPWLGHGFGVDLALEQGWPEASPHWRSWSPAVEKMLAVHCFRRRMHKEMA